MKNLLLYIVAIVILIYINFYNRKLVKKKGKLDGYDRSQALALDAFAGRNYRSLWNATLIKPEGYKFGVEGETMSSCLGKNEVDGTLTTEPQPDMPRWFYGTNLSRILDKAFNEKNHCFNAIDLTKGDWHGQLKS